MTRGRAVQTGSAAALFERPRHTFVGNFIGSPGMNFLPAEAGDGVLRIAGRALPLPPGLPSGALKLGVRPEYLRLAAAEAAGALPFTADKLQDLGTHVMLTASAGGATGQVVKARLGPDAVLPQVGAPVWLQVLGTHTCFYRDEELVEVRS
jgi:glycerol transport system ATP-binding protein